METIELSNTEASNWHQMKCHNLNFNHERKLNNFQLQFIAATLIIERLMSEFPNWFKEDSFNCFQALLHCFTFFLWHCVLCSQHLQVRAPRQKLASLKLRLIHQALSRPISSAASCTSRQILWRCAKTIDNWQPWQPQWNRRSEEGGQEKESQRLGARFI